MKNFGKKNNSKSQLQRNKETQVKENSRGDNSNPLEDVTWLPDNGRKKA